jgi:hypothetical protein
MDQHYRPYRWVAVIVTLVVAAMVGFFAYNAGVAHGIATAGQPITGGAALVPPYAYGWYRPWGFGFGFFGPFLFILLWLFVLRGIFWGGPWRRFGCYGRGYYGGPAGFDEWHRRAHERMTSKEPAGPPRDDDRPRS